MEVSSQDINDIVRTRATIVKKLRATTSQEIRDALQYELSEVEKEINKKDQLSFNFEEGIND